MPKRMFGEMIGAAAGSYMAGRSTRSRGMVSSGGVRFSKERHLVGKKRRRTVGRLSDTLSILNPYRVRWQATSNSLVGPGRIPIGFGYHTYPYTVLPIHMISLTNNTKGNQNTFKGGYNHGLFRIIRNEADGTTSWSPFASQLAAGVNNWNNSGTWQVEQSDLPGQSNRWSFYHKWTEVRANLYGAKYLPLEYTISVVQLPQNYDPQKFSHAASGVLPAGEFDEVSRMFTDLSRTLVANPINIAGTKQEWKNNIKVLKQYKVNIGPLSYENAAAENAAPVHVGNVKQFKCFIRHDRWRDYSWADQSSNITPDKALGDLGWDAQDDDTVLIDVEWGKKVYLMITCTSGPLVGTVAYNTEEPIPHEYTSIPNYEGTYDLMVRNEFRVGKPS